MTGEFEEIGHSGGKITFDIGTNEQGDRGYQTTFTSNRPVPTVMIAVYALPQGVPVETIQLGGIGQAWNPPPFPGACQYSLPPIAKGSLATTARNVMDIGVADHGPGYALIVALRQAGTNSSRRHNSAMFATTARSYGMPWTLDKTVKLSSTWIS